MCAYVYVYAYIYNNYPVVIFSGLWSTFINRVSPSHQGSLVEKSYYWCPHFTDENSEPLWGLMRSPCTVALVGPCTSAPRQRHSGAEMQPVHCSQVPAQSSTCPEQCWVFLIHTKALSVPVAAPKVEGQNTRAWSSFPITLYYDVCHRAPPLGCLMVLSPEGQELVCTLASRLFFALHPAPVTVKVKEQPEAVWSLSGTLVQESKALGMLPGPPQTRRLKNMFNFSGLPFPQLPHLYV